MLHKEFVRKGHANIAVIDGCLKVTREHRVPLSYADAANASKTSAITLRPSLKYPVNFYCVTHVRGKEEPRPGQERSELRVVAMSDGCETRYYWFSKKTRETYSVRMASASFEEAWLNLFKGMLMDDRPRTIQLYNLFKYFFMDYFETMEGVGAPLDITLTGKWKGQFVNINVERLPLQSPSTVLMNVNGKDNMVSLHSHPLVELLG